MEIATRERAYVRVAGPDAEDYLQRMVSNDVEALAEGESCAALLLTPKARVIATLRVWRRGEDDFLLLTEPELGEVALGTLLRSRFVPAQVSGANVRQLVEQRFSFALTR